MYFWRAFYLKDDQIIFVDGVLQYEKPEDATAEWDEMTASGLIQPYMRMHGIAIGVDQFLRASVVHVVH